MLNIKPGRSKVARQPVHEAPAALDVAAAFVRTLDALMDSTDANTLSERMKVGLGCTASRTSAVGCESAA